MPLKMFLLLMLNLAPHLIPLLRMLLLLMLNVASYLPHHFVAVAVVVLASNTPVSKIHFCMLNIGEHLITMLLLLLLLNLTSFLAFISPILGDPHANGVQ